MFKVVDIRNNIIRALRVVVVRLPDDETQERAELELMKLNSAAILQRIKKYFNGLKTIQEISFLEHISETDIMSAVREASSFVSQVVT